MAADADVQVDDERELLRERVRRSFGGADRRRVDGGVVAAGEQLAQPGDHEAPRLRRAAS
jgi:hypothetical protein